MAQPQPKSAVFAQRYNQIDQHLYGEFQLLALERDAMADFEATGDLFSGFVGAVCRLDRGKKQEALEFFGAHLPYLPLDLNDPLNINIYLFYARILSYCDRLIDAVKVLERTQSTIPNLGLSNVYAAIKIYGFANRFDDIDALLDLAIKIHPDWEERLVHPVLLERFVLQNNPQGAIEYLLELGIANGIYDINATNLDAVLDFLRSILIHPKLRPDLSDREVVYLNKIREWALEFFKAEDEIDMIAAAEATRRLNDSDDEIISLEQVIRELGLENAI